MSSSTNENGGRLSRRKLFPQLQNNLRNWTPSSTDDDEVEPQSLEISRIRSTLNLDPRFFPSGVKPGNFIQIKGPEGCGKTFLLTYFLARFLFVYPTKVAAFINTSHHFNIQNLISILQHFDPEITENVSFESPPCPKLKSYIRRFFIYRCYTAKEFMSIFMLCPPNKSPIESLLLANQEAALVLIDSLDALSFISETYTIDKQNVTQLISEAVGPSKTPVICTTMDGNISSIWNFRNQSDDGTGGQTFQNAQLNQRLIITEDYFTNVLTLSPLPLKPMLQIISNAKYFQKSSEEEKNGVFSDNLRGEVIAHLRCCSRRSIHGNPNVSAIVAGTRNHRVKFSICSGMLWVCDDEGVRK